MAKIIGKNTGGDAPGHFKDYAGGPVEPGYLLCDGTSYLVATYPVLFSKIGYVWGGVGANFNVPYSNGRSHVGKGTYTDPVSGSITRTLGASAGAEAHVLTIGQLAAHDHGGATGGDSPSHTHSGPTFNSKNDNQTGVLGGNGVSGASYTTGTPNQNHTHSVSSQGLSNSHNNMHPYIVVTKMIKY